MDLRLPFLLFFYFYELFVVFYAFAELAEEIHQANDLNLAQLVHFLVQVTLGGEEDLHGGAQAGDLHFPVEPALVAAYAIEYLRDVVELSLELVQEQFLVEVFILIFEEARLVEAVGALAYRLRQQVGHVYERQLVILFAQARGVVVEEELLVDPVHRADHQRVHKVHVLEALRVLAKAVVVHTVIHIGLITAVLVVIIGGDVHVYRGIQP